MGEKIYKPILEDGEHLLRSTDNPDYFRGLSRDENNKNPNIPEWEEYDSDDLIDSGQRASSESSVNAKMIVGAIGIAIGACLPKAYLFIKKLPGWIRENKIRGKAEVIGGLNVKRSVIDSNDEKVQESNKLESAFNEYRENISSEEARRELLEAFILCLASVKKMKRVANANVIKSTGEIVSGKETIDTLTNENLIESINGILRENPSLINEYQLVMLSDTLGYCVFCENEFIPISGSAISESLNGQKENVGL